MALDVQLELVLADADVVAGLETGPGQGGDHADLPQPLLQVGQRLLVASVVALEEQLDTAAEDAEAAVLLALDPSSLFDVGFLLTYAAVFGIASVAPLFAAPLRRNLPAPLADGIAAIPGTEVLNNVVFTQVCASFGSDERTQEVVRRMLTDGTAWTSGSRWHDRAVLRVALCNWSTTDADVATTLAALRRAAA